MMWLVGLLSFITFLCFQAQGIFGGDSGDLVTAAVTHGVPHPPGYPLYTFIGWLANHIPIATPAWRVGLVSSVPHALVLVILYLLVYRLTRKKQAALFAVFTLLGNYLFFLYSVTPEVFALFDLFVVLLIYIGVLYIETRNGRLLYWFIFVFGLSLTHHEAILFLVPAFIYIWWKLRRLVRKSVRNFGTRIRLVVLFLLGLVPYTYVTIAARTNAIINWDHAATLTNFIRLVTRADYGTFISNGAYGSNVLFRFIEIQAYAQYVLVDYSFIGILCIAMGMYFLWKTKPDIGKFLLLAALFLGPLFLFYASFPLTSRFTLGTYERFLLPSYVVLTILLGVGYVFLVEGVRSLCEKIVSSKKLINFAVTGFALLIFLYPATLIGMTVWRFWGLPQDRTGDELGMDILAPLPKSSILLIANDTPLFTTQYVRYALHFRPDVAVVHYSILSFPDYRIIIAKEFPRLIIPSVSDETFAASFAEKNSVRHAVFSNVQFTLPDGWYWVPYGLVYQLYAKESLPQIPDVIKTNSALWSGYHNPTSGILSRYNHLMLSDVRDTYAGARMNYGKTILRAKEIGTAQIQFTEAIRLGGDTQTAPAYTFLGLTYLFQNQCQRALNALDNAQKQINVDTQNVLLYKGITYRDCLGDAKKAKPFLDQAEKFRAKGETQLDTGQQ